ncbi:MULTISPECIES: hydantoinase B/oxoprolinase family protein [Erwiniaceae]|uniref:Hydantoinase B/oxoprolinase family protein n=1 Tax=Enterobacter agglomerans TaxID=549 RepID=A0AAN2K795_ENTAG|nr:MULTISPECIES: hydantoinase B/oxoprolinase family protein [Erwiniaceae]CAH6337445.1 Hydantoinase B/oxoprolinase family protein [Pantoea agglomerans]
MTIVDTVTFNIFTNSVQAIAQEMSNDFIRTAYSTVIREAADCSTCLVDRQGRVLAQSQNIPLHLNSVSPAVQGALAKTDVSKLTEDDVIILNDAYNGGQHLSDVYLFSPIIYEGTLIGFSGSVGHHVDLGHSPGYNIYARDVFEERMRFTPMVFSLSRDWNGGILEQLIRANVRIPRDTIGDLNAQLTANETGRRRVKELIGRYSVDIVIAASDQLLDYAESFMRDAISEVPDGVYRGVDYIDTDGLDKTNLEVHVAVTVKGDTLHLDFEGTSPQVKTAINCPRASTISSAYSALKMLLTKPSIPLNDGSYRPISISAPEGSLVNPIPFAPVEGRNVVVMRVFQSILLALSKALPDRIPAPGYDTRTEVDLHWQGARTYHAISEQLGGGYGAGPANDGADQLDDPLGNCRNTPVEALELSQSFFRVERYELRPDSGGAGRFRGGLGAIRTYRFLQDGVHMSVYSDRFVNKAPGVQGGADGTNAYIKVTRKDGSEEQLPPKGAAILNAGDELEVAIGGGAGYGDPATRDRESVEADLKSGKVTSVSLAAYGSGARENA